MPKHRSIEFTVPAILVTALLIIIAGQGSSLQKELPGKSQRKRVDETRFPIADFSAPDPTNPAERAKRRKRGQKYDKSDWTVNPTAASDSTVRIDFVDRTLLALPVSQSTTILTGKITDARAYLSNDRTGVYSVFTAEVDQVLKNNSPAFLGNGTSIELEREGGRVKFPSGRVHIYMTNELNMPRVGSRYVLFLSSEDYDSVFQIVTGYELCEGKVMPLDELPKTRSYENVDETVFMAELRAKILNP